ncbi:MAG: hemolysin III family protein [Lachnospiraceae bacterium]|nr:hemolysin III family protein [Lachnospiraceae bacterium]
MSERRNTISLSRNIKAISNNSICGSGSSISDYIKDPGSAITHFIGFIAALISLPFLIIHYIRRGADMISLLSVIIFAFSMMLLYAASTLYHTLVLPRDKELIFKKVDHLMIFILICGSYTPVCLTILRDKGGIPLLILVWSIAILGMIFKLFWVTCPKWLSSIIYVSMGWLCLLAFPQILSEMDFRGFLFLLIGGIAYTVGGIIYAMKFKKLNEISPYFGSHEIFHVFVLVGNALHFVSIFEYLL